MRTIQCPACKKPGYIVKEKPRKKNVTLTRRGYYKANNIPYPKEKAHNCGWSPHKDYVSSKRTRSEYFRIKHNYKDVIKDIKSGRPKIGWKTRFCYIGSVRTQIERYHKLNTDTQGNVFSDAQRVITKIEETLKKDPKELTQDDVNMLYRWKSRPRQRSWSSIDKEIMLREILSRTKIA